MLGHGFRAGALRCALIAAVNLGCSAESPPPNDAASAAQRPVAEGLRVVLADGAKSVCVANEGCSGSPKGTIRLTPLQPRIREVVAEALVAAGFELVAADAERDIIAGVEWQGTDTIAVGLRDRRDNLIDQARFRRSLQRCEQLPNLTWDSCWAANFAPMKEALAGPLRTSPALLAFARKARGLVPSTEASRTPAATPAPVRASPAQGVMGDRLQDVQVQETVARYREQLQRGCWLPARESRDPSAPGSARVSTMVTIAPGGTVAGVATAGDPPGYPRLAACIAAQLKSWQFPPAHGPTHATIPFVFTGE